MKKTRHEVCRAEELIEEGRKIVEVDGRSIGVFYIQGEFYAIQNFCPHQGAPLCKGELTGTTCAEGVDTVAWQNQGKILRCPWHGWEFDITTGKSVFNPHRWKVHSFDVDVESPKQIELDEEIKIDDFPVEVESGIVVVWV